MARDQYIQPANIPQISQNNNYKTSIGNINLDPNSTISSKGNIVNSINSNVTGPNNIVSGSGHNVEGNSNFVFGTNHTVTSNSNILLGGDSHNINGDGNIVIGAGQGITVNGETLALTSINEMDFYTGGSTFSNNVASSFNIPSGIILPVTASTTANFVVDSTNNNGTYNYTTIKFNSTIFLSANPGQTDIIRIPFATLFGNKQTTAYLKTITKGVSTSTSGGHQNWFSREQKHFIFWNGTALNTIPSVVDNSLFSGSGVDWGGAATADGICGWAQFFVGGISRGLVMVIANAIIGTSDASIPMKWSFDIEIRYTESDT
jgi:hypothetical protein